MRLGAFVLAFVAACSGCSAGGSAHDDASAKGGAGGASDAPPAGVAQPPFATAPPAVGLRKVKALLLGGVPTAAEFDAVAKDANALASLVDAWMDTPGFRVTLLDFFATQFQQAQVQPVDFVGMYNGNFQTPDDSLMLAIRQSFARTVLQLMDENRPFTEVATTQRYMMTSELMSFYAYTDTSYLSDVSGLHTRWYTGDDNFGPTFRQAAGPVSLSDAANPASPAYLTFYTPNLTASYVNQTSTADVATCAAVDPVHLINLRTFARANTWGNTVWDVMHGRGFWYFWPLEYQPNSVWCRADALNGNSIWTAADANDWRMVEVRAPQSGELPTEFFDLPRIRASGELLMRAERVGFFTTPAFLAQWGTNASNSSRAATNQALLAALGHQIDGNDLLPLSSPTAVDPNHAAQPACFACHQSLDPMRQFFRQSYSLPYGIQDDPNQARVPATFAFRGARRDGVGVVAFGQALAQHPDFAAAWTLKLCSWANSAPCQENDPEVLRIAALFAASDFNFRTMAKALFTSPLVTYASATQSARANGKVVSIARRGQFCRMVGARLGIDDVCTLAQASADGQNNLSSRAAALPGDGYSRGADRSLYVNAPEPFYIGNLENMCGLLAARVIDGDVPWASGSDPNAAVDKLVQGLMGVSAAAAATPTGILRDHVQQAQAAGASATLAVRSAFVTACSSVATATVGQ